MHHTFSMRLYRSGSVGEGIPGTMVTDYSSSAATPIQETTHEAPKSASQAVLRRMQLTLHATRPRPHGASAVGASDVSLVGEIPTCSVPGIVGMRGSMVIRLRPCKTTTPYPPSFPIKICHSPVIVCNAYGASGARVLRRRFFCRYY